MKKLIFVSIFALTLISVYAASCNRVNSTGSETPEADFSKAREDGLKAHWSWTTEEWTNDDKSYYEISNSIEDAIAKGEDIYAMAAQYKKAAQQNPKDSQALFTWGYAAYKASKAEITDYDRMQSLKQGVAIALESIPSPKSYEYSRLHFLIYSEFPPAQLRVVGERLVQRNPKDYDVKQTLVRVLFYSTMLDDADKKQALSLANDLIKLDPKRASGYGNLGAVYYISWRKSGDKSDGDKSDGDKAIAACQTSLELLPKDHYDRPIVERTIKQIQSKQK